MERVRLPFANVWDEGGSSEQLCVREKKTAESLRNFYYWDFSVGILNDDGQDK
jgi:hypothetical protein